jgi:hypothetical protein
MGVSVGQEVGYNVRFMDVTSPKTKVKYMTGSFSDASFLLDESLILHFQMEC